jgi:hypothetical protein
MRYFMGVLAITMVGVGSLQIGRLVAQEKTPVQTVKDGVLDEIRLYVDKLPGTTRLVIRPFSATDADITHEKNEDTKTMQASGPAMLASRVAAKLKQLGPFTDVSEPASGAEPAADSILLEGRFTELNPGSRAARFVVGFGAGHSSVSVEGSVKTADGTSLATFKQRRLGSAGAFGGDSVGKMSEDVKNIGDDIAKFLSAWANGKKLR